MTESLFSLVSQANTLSRMLVETSGEITPEIEALMAHIDVSMPGKVDGYATVIERLEVEAQYWEDKANAYYQVAKAHKTLRERLLAAIKQAMIAMNTDELKGIDVKYKLSNSKPALVIGDDLDPAWKLTITEVVADKERIRSALELGNIIKGAKLVAGKTLRRYMNKGD